MLTRMLLSYLSGSHFAALNSLPVNTNVLERETVSKVVMVHSDFKQPLKNYFVIRYKAKEKKQQSESIAVL